MISMAKNLKVFVKQLAIYKPVLLLNQNLTQNNFFWYWCYSLSIEYYDSVKEWLSNPYS